MPIIARYGLPQQGDTFNVRIDDPATREGNAVSIFFNDVRVALGRIIGNVGAQESSTMHKYVDPRRIIPMDSETNMGKNLWTVEVESVFEPLGEYRDPYT